MRELVVKTLPPDGAIDYVPEWIEARAADCLMARLQQTLEWEQRSIRMFGRVFAQPRLIRFMGDPGIVYRYSGGSYIAAPWHPALLPLRRRLREEYRLEFNCVLINQYRDGRDSMGWHADDEPELGPRPTIASVSLGAERRFQLRSRQLPRQRFEIKPGHGSLLLMRGALQQHWQHQLPKTARPVGPRINLTFRRVLSRD
ncbi:MAG: alpha-ketoglutarate-dependent dioxygenase AlkB [Gammaproteobacteria bacterium HGW-Gammaproteobacteria-8]|nr:MAG: alpha-ketoglutarate-dependent dioxygenase AlkB [Gammaproteobacteria bacterium HGW-Gammaproteobacteria-8]